MTAVDRGRIVEVKMMAALAEMELLNLETPWRVLLGCYEICSLSDPHRKKWGGMQPDSVESVELFPFLL